MHGFGGGREIAYSPTMGFTNGIHLRDLAVIKEFANCIESAVTEFALKKGWK